jgi:hypothetical protein
VLAIGLRVSGGYIYKDIPFPSVMILPSFVSLSASTAGLVTGVGDGGTTVAVAAGRVAVAGTAVGGTVVAVGGGGTGVFVGGTRVGGTAVGGGTGVGVGAGAHAASAMSANATSAIKIVKRAIFILFSPPEKECARAVARESINHYARLPICYFDLPAGLQIIRKKIARANPRDFFILRVPIFVQSKRRAKFPGWLQTVARTILRPNRLRTVRSR